LQEVGLTVPEAELFRPEADVAVVDLIGGYESYIDRFYFVAEILSDGNTDKDIAVKRQRYLQHPDNLYFMLIEQKRVRAELLGRASGWQPVLLEGLDAVLDVPEWGFKVALAALYRGTPLASAGQA
jgi:Uma2 family endonuclease